MENLHFETELYNKGASVSIKRSNPLKVGVVIDIIKNSLYARMNDEVKLVKRALVENKTAYDKLAPYFTKKTVKPGQFVIFKDSPIGFAYGISYLVGIDGTEPQLYTAREL